MNGKWKLGLAGAALACGLSLAVPAGVLADGTEVSLDVFTDAEFRSYVSDVFDKDNNHRLSEAEIAGVKDIYINGMYDYGYDIVSLEGIEYFTELGPMSRNSTK